MTAKKRRKKRKMQVNRRVAPVLAVLLLIIVVLAGIFVSYLIDKYSPSKAVSYTHLGKRLCRAGNFMCYPDTFPCGEALKALHRKDCLQVYFIINIQIIQVKNM